MILSLFAWAALAGGPSFESFFSHRALVEVAPGAGDWARLPLPEAVLKEASGDLSDVRLLDVAGRRVSFRLVRRAVRALPTAVLPARLTSADRKVPAKDTPGPTVETYGLELPSLPVEMRGWTLWLQGGASEFVCRASVEAVGPSGRRPLVRGAPMFRLPTQGAERLEVPLPRIEGGESLSVELTCERLVQPSFAVEARATLEPSPELLVPAELRDAAGTGLPRPGPHGASSTLLSWPRPPGFVPSALRLSTTTRFFDRRVRVYDIGARGERREVGWGRVFRIPGVAAAENLDVPIGFVHGARFEVKIEDADSSPLEGLKVVQVLEQPALLFAAADAQPPLYLYFGGGLIGSAAFETAGANDEAELRRIEGSPQREAVLGAVEPNRAFQPGGALAALQRPGAPVDARQFSHRATASGRCPSGVCTLALPLEAVGELQPGFPDVRVADSEGRQVPFVAHQELLEVTLDAALARQADGWSEYPVGLPGRQQVNRLTLALSTPMFHRRVELSGLDEQSRRVVLADDVLSSNPGDAQSGRLALAVRGVRASQLLLKIRDGEEAPLERVRLEVEVRVPVLKVLAPAGTYSVLVGNPLIQAPQYDVTGALDLIASAKAEPMTLSPLVPNPEFRALARLVRGDGPTQLLLWGALLLAVLVLGGLTVRMVRKAPPTSSV